MKNLKKKIKEPWKIDLDLLTPKRISKYEDALEVLRLMRKGSTIRDGSNEVGISIPTVKKYVDDALKIKDNRLVAKSADSLLRKMLIYEEGEEVWITVKGIRTASKIGRYHSAVGRLVDRNERNALEPFTKIKDFKGKIHKLETNRKEIFEIFDRREEPEFFTIYQR